VNKTFIKGLLLAVVVCVSALLSAQARADDQDLTYSVSYTDEELDNLLAPIALYADPLLAQMLPASTYPQEVADAEAWLQSNGDMSGIDDQPWDESVRAIAHYPGVLKMMADNMDWTANLGDAFLNQPEAVTDSIQRLRWKARDLGNLVSNREQSVIIDNGYIQIVPAQPQYIYVPQYDPTIVYIQAPSPYYSPFIIYGVGLTIGGWLTMDFDWGHHHVIYHGWNRPGWVDHARPYVHLRDVLVNRSRQDIQRTWRHDRSHGDPARYLASRPSGPHADRYRRTGEVRGRIPSQPGHAGAFSAPKGDLRSYINRGRQSRGIVTQQPPASTPRYSPRPAIPTPTYDQRRAMPSPNVTEQRTMPATGVRQRPEQNTPHGGNVNRPAPAREVRQPVRTPSVTFGGYRGADEAKKQSQRGQTSRQSAEGMLKSAPKENRGNASSGGNAPDARQRKQR
jgi:Protein of unknown function (DUF3300)